MSILKVFNKSSIVSKILDKVISPFVLMNLPTMTIASTLTITIFVIQLHVGDRVMISILCDTSSSWQIEKLKSWYQWKWHERHRVMLESLATFVLNIWRLEIRLSQSEHFYFYLFVPDSWAVGGCCISPVHFLEKLSTKSSRGNIARSKQGMKQ